MASLATGTFVVRAVVRAAVRAPVFAVAVVIAPMVERPPGVLPAATAWMLRRIRLAPFVFDGNGWDEGGTLG